MENKKKALLTGSLLAGALMATASLQANAATDLFRFDNLGTGEAVRSRLLEGNSHARSLELNCGEKKDSTSMKKKGKEGKCGEGKCGEGKCGEKKKDKKMKKDSTAVKPKSAK
ncbi:HvfA family oxazolone/thioamide-modified RiPP metallophore [Chitinophaga japonensis]|uniref:Low-complexity protein n=1 Tax=Chitinophaga japonensis TaxID=104662 RepID=A0A562SMK2_CHIJA|nr:hypothetical protein [Chitinophaga japonensis]TWI82482.1 hypothetical protein LX66_5055 [Chitinophaga japonensis]